MDDDEGYGAGSDELNRWYSRSPDDIEQERQAAEQAGREAYADAIRTGADVQARTPAELVALGRSRLAQQDAAGVQLPTSSTEDCGRVHDGLMQADALVRGAANKATFGLADHLEAAGDAVASGGTLDQMWKQYQQNLRQQYARDAYDAQHRSIAHGLGDLAGEGLSYLEGVRLGAGVVGALGPKAKGALGEGLSVLKTVSRLDRPKGFQVEERVPGGYSRIDHTTLKGQFVESKFGPTARLSPRQREAQQKLGDAYRVDRWGPRHIGYVTGAAAASGSAATDDPNQP